MTAESTSRRMELIAALVVMAGGTVGFFAVPHMVSGWAFAIPGLTDSSLSPTFFPRVGMAAMVLAGLGVVLSLGQRNGVIPFVTMNDEDWKRALIASVHVVAFAFVLPIFGFFASSAMFIFGISATAGYRRLVVLASTAILFPLVTLLVFRWGLNVLLPSGPWM